MAAAPAAHQRFRQSSRASFWIGITAATILHAAVFAGSPVFALDPGTAAEDADPLQVVPPEVRMPETPPPVRRPVAPVISPVAPADLTLDPVTPEDWAAHPLDPPAPGSDDAEVILPTPMEVAPRLLNVAHVQRALRRHYPPVLRDAGVGGTVGVWFHIDERGRVLATRIQRRSGYDALDRAALAVAGEMEFSPAYHRDRRVPVWVALDITFEVQE